MLDCGAAEANLREFLFAMTLDNIYHGRYE